MQVTVGTGAQLIVPRDRVPADPRRITHTYRAAAPMRWYSMAAIQNAGLALEWVIRILHADWDAAYDSLDAVPPGSDGLVFLPYLTGERTPHLNPRLSASWAGMRLHHGREHLLRAALEGVAFSVRDGAQALADTGADTRSPRLAGGGSTHPKWRQLLADVLGEELYEVANRAASARGAALLGGVAAGVFPDVRSASALAPQPTLAATPRDPAAYEAPYQHFRAAVRNSLPQATP
jgi:xylulokinase